MERTEAARKGAFWGENDPGSPGRFACRIPRIRQSRGETMSHLSRGRRDAIAAVVLSAGVLPLTLQAHAASYTLLTAFNGIQGNNPEDTPILDNAGNIYGTAANGSGETKKASGKKWLQTLWLRLSVQNCAGRVRDRTTRL